MDPINYMLDVKSPIDEYMKGFEFARNELANQQTMQMNQQNMDVARQNFADQQRALREQRAAAEQQRAEAAQLQTDIYNLATSAEGGRLTSDSLIDFKLKHAKTFEDLSAAYAEKSEQQKSSQASSSVNLATALLGPMPEVGIAMLKEQIAAVGPDSEQAKPLQVLLNVAETNPKYAGTSVLTTGAATGILSNDLVKNVLEATQPLGQDFRPATPEEAAAYGAVAGQVNVKTGEFKAINPPTGFSVTTTPEGGTTVTQGPGVGGADVGKRGQDYVYTTTPEGKQVAQPIAGTPAALQVTETAGKLDAAIEVGNNMLATLESIVGRPAGDGMTAVKPNEALPGILGMFEGRLPAKTQAQADLLAKVEQVQGQAFLEAFSILKGAGAITEQEGIKATQAYARLQRTQSPEAFTASLNEFAEIVRLGIKRAQDQKLSLPQVVNPTQTMGQTPTAPVTPTNQGLSADDMKYLGVNQ